MRYVRYLFLVVLGLALLTIAFANRGDVTLHLLPDEIAAFTGWNTAATLPLFIVIFGAIVAGVALGFVWEWLREHKHRAEAATQRREKERLAREVERLKPASEKQTDDVLALLETRSAAR